MSFVLYQGSLVAKGKYAYLDIGALREIISTLKNDNFQ